VHPTFLYELLWDVGVAVLLVWADRRYQMGRGRVFALYVAAYTFGRFWIELLRTDPATMVFGVRINVITSAVLFVAAVAYLLLVRGPRETLAPAEPTADAGAEAGSQADQADSAAAEAATADADATADARAETEDDAEARPAAPPH
jgi:hypothetical protein